MKRTFDLIVITWIGLQAGKGLAKMTIARHSSQDSGLAQDFAQAASIIL